MGRLIISSYGMNGWSHYAFLKSRANDMIMIESYSVLKSVLKTESVLAKFLKSASLFACRPVNDVIMNVLILFFMVERGST